MSGDHQDATIALYACTASASLAGRVKRLPSKANGLRHAESL
jgi:hypothetical protein